MTTHRFGRIEVSPATRQLLVDGRPVALGSRALDLMLALIERRDRLVGKDELLDLVWPGVVVEENNLQVQISALRKILGQGTIATVAGRGYRFALEPSDRHFYDRIVAVLRSGGDREAMDAAWTDGRALDVAAALAKAGAWLAAPPPE